MFMSDNKNEIEQEAKEQLQEEQVQGDILGEVEKPLSRKTRIKNALVELIIYVLIIVLCVVFVPRYVIQRTIVDGTSMNDTLQDKDNLLVEKVSIHFKNPERFDVIVFYPYGRENEKYYIKRVIGLPGETIQIVGDTIYVDGEVLEEDYGKDPMTSAGVASSPITLGDDEFFVLGDNRAVSEDSRVFGPVSKDKIEGRAIFRIYPLSEFGTFR